jgi:hypothetical protein
VSGKRKGGRSGATRKPIVFTRDPDAFASAIADAVVEAVNRERIARGLPPLQKRAARTAITKR